MTCFRRSAGLLLLLTLAACSRSSRYLQSRCAAINSLGMHNCTLYVPALQELINRPETFDGLPVQLLGYATLEPEGTALFVSRESYEHGFTRDAVWLVVPDSLRAGITATVSIDTGRQRRFSDVASWFGSLLRGTASAADQTAASAAGR